MIVKAEDRGFLPTVGLFWGGMWAPPQSQNEQKLPKIVINIPNSLALQFDKNLTKNSKVTDIYNHTLLVTGKGDH